MIASNRFLIVAALSLAVCFGCSAKPPQQPADARTSGDSDNSRSASPAVPKAATGELLRPGSLVKVGDVMPSAELPALLGKPHTLNDLLGEKLTVVCFWSVTTSREEHVIGKPPSEAKRATDESLQFLLEKIAWPFSPKAGPGPVRVIGVNVGDAIEDIRQVPLAFADGEGPATTNTISDMTVIRENPDKSRLVVIHRDASTDMLPCLLDTKSGLFAKIAGDGKTPRVYLLDAKGKILWFDVGFFPPAREELLRTIQTLLDRK
jgi:hypothetical protein